jgi:hypothetical protein
MVEVGGANGRLLAKRRRHDEGVRHYLHDESDEEDTE